MTSEAELINNRYQVVRLIGCGGMGDVFLGDDTLTGEKVAIKKLRSGMPGNLTQIVERFLREGEALQKLNHPNIVKVLETFGEGARQYIIMEYVGGGSLADLLLREPQLPVERIVSIGLELSDALSRAHHLHILHRDIKPANILLAVDGTPRLTDFGLARIGELPRMTESSSIMGTLQYISPEVFEGREVNERSDIWSFGVVLFEMLTGRLPFNYPAPFDLIWAIKNESLPIIENLRSGIPESLVNLTRRMLRKDNSARVESARHLGVEFETIQKELRNTKKDSTNARNEGNKSLNETRVIRVLIADDHAVVRQGLRMFIDLQDDMEVVGEGTNGGEAIELALKLKPDVVLLDLVMPEIDGVEATNKIKAAYPEARILILTSFGEDNKIIPAIQAGAQGYLLKDIRPDQLVQSVREAYKGQTQLHPEIAKSLLSMVQKKDFSGKNSSGS